MGKGTIGLFRLMFVLAILAAFLAPTVFPFPASADWGVLVKDELYMQQPRTLEGKVFLDKPISGAAVRIYDRSGGLLHSIDSATGEDGRFSITRALPQSFTLVIAGGLMGGKPSDHELSAHIPLFDETGYYKVNAVTTLLDAYLDRHPGLSHADAKDDVEAFLSLPESVDLDDIIYSSEWYCYYFSHYKFMKEAEAYQGVTAFVEHLLDEEEAGKTRSFYDGTSIGSSMFQDAMAALLKGALSKLGGEGAGWILGLLNMGGSDVDDRLAEMQTDLLQIMNELTQIINALTALAQQLALDTNEVETYIQGQSAQDAITTIKTHYGPDDPDSEGDTNTLKYFSYLTSENSNATTKAQIATLVGNINGAWDIEDQVQQIHDAILPDIGNTDGLLDLWTKTFLLQGPVDSDTLMNYYITLEQYFGVLLFYQFKGANLVVEALNYQSGSGLLQSVKDGATPASSYLTGTFQPNIKEQTDRFLYNVVRLITSNADLLDSQADFLPAGAQDILARATFFIIQTLGQDHYGLRTGAIGTQQLVNTIPAMGTGDNSVVADASTDVELSDQPYDAWSNCLGWNDKTLNYGDIYSYKSFDLSPYGGDPGTYPLWATITCGGDKANQMVGAAVVKTYTEDYVEDPDGTISYGYYAAPIRNGGREYMMAYLVEHEDSVQKSGGVTYNSSGSLDQNLNLSLSLSAKNNDTNDASSISQTLEWYHPFTFTGSQAETAYLNISGSTSGSAYWQGDNGSGNESSISVNIGIWDVTHNQLVTRYSQTAAASNDETKNLDLTLNTQLSFTLQPGVSYYAYANVNGSGDIHYVDGVSDDVEFSYNINLELDTLSLTFVNSGN